MSNTKTPIVVKRLKKADGTIAHIKDGKLHNWDGPALIPQGDKKLAEYYINTPKMNLNKHIEIKRVFHGTKIHL